MEAVGHDAGVGEVFADQGAVVAGQIHAHDAHLGLAFQTLQIGLQRELPSGPARHRRSCGFSDRRGWWRSPFRRVKKCSSMPSTGGQRGGCHSANWRCEPASEVALDGGRTDAFPPSQTAAIDAVQVLLVDGLSGRPRWPAGSAGCRAGAGGNSARSRDTWTCGPQFEHGMPQSPVLMAHPPLNPPLVSQAALAAVRTESRPRIIG